MNKKSGLIILGCVLIGATFVLFWPKGDDVASQNKAQANLNKVGRVKNNKARSVRVY